jgi:hypothetical protein
MVDYIEADTLVAPSILFLNYSAYDSTYAAKLRGLTSKFWPKARFSEHWSGDLEELARQLPGKDLVIIGYPTHGDPDLLNAMGMLLKTYARSGGRVLFTGTHSFSILQHLDLIDLDYGYYCSDQKLISKRPDHPLLAGTEPEVFLQNFAYPLDISDPDFQTLVEVRGYPVVGLKPYGQGEVYYLGLEYFYDEPFSSRLLANVVRLSVYPELEAGFQSEPIVAEAAPVVPDALPQPDPVLPRKAINSDIHKIKVYPNPYVTKAQVDIELSEEAVISLEMTDETGRIVRSLVSRETRSPGMYQFELPNVAPGIYFLHYQLNDLNTVRKVVKVVSP